MDSRIALQPNTVLKFPSGFEFVITGELARGGSGIVYNGYYLDSLNERKPIRIKECYPFKCRISRFSDNSLIIPEAERVLFEKDRERFCAAYRLGNALFQTDGLTNFTANTYNLFSGYNTVYTISAYMQGKELTHESCESVGACISVVRSLAKAVSRIHSKGYLYLDIKPSNVYMLNGTTELIQLFDFDSLVPIEHFTAAFPDAIPVSFTKGFAAPELQSGKLSLIGRQSDVYAVGAVLFYLLFSRTPDFFDCEPDAVYDFADSKLNGVSFPDRLYIGLTDFFHSTLANYAPDRYPDMEPAIRCLSELLKLSEPCTRFVHSSRIPSADLCIGRERELKSLDELISSGCVFVTGMGGIGKSTLVRSWLSNNRQSFDSVLWLDFSGSVAETITDDFAVHINGVHHDSAESLSDYFLRKLAVLRELAVDKRALIVIDNYTGDGRSELGRLLDTGWQLIIITRSRSLAQGFATLDLGRLSGDGVLLTLFEKHMGATLSPEEASCARAIIAGVDGHTLAVELLAKQIGNPLHRMSVADAAVLVDKLGFSRISDEKVSYQKDQSSRQDTVRNIISLLFEAGELSPSQRSLLFCAGMFGVKGVAVHRFCAMLSIDNRDELGELYKNGWINVDEGMITLHPVVAEVAASWPHTPGMLASAQKLMVYISRELSTPGKSLRELAQASAVIKAAGKAAPLKASPEYRELLFRVIEQTPYEPEDYLRELTEEYLSLPAEGQAERHMEVCRRLVDILLEREETDSALKRLSDARELAEKSCDFYVRGQYNYLLAGWFDYRLCGAYDCRTAEERILFGRLKDSVTAAIRYMKRSKHPETHQRLCEYYRTKALILIRGGGRERAIKSLLEKMQAELSLLEKPELRLVRDCTMTLAWYHTYYEPDFGAVMDYLETAESLTDSICRTDIEKIDEFICPAANVLFEWDQAEAALARLYECIELCREHPDIQVYERKVAELKLHIEQVSGEQQK